MQYVACCIVCMLRNRVLWLVSSNIGNKHCLRLKQTNEKKESLQIRRRLNRGATFSLRIKEIPNCNVNFCMKNSIVYSFSLQYKKWFSNKFNNLVVGAP